MTNFDYLYNKAYFKEQIEEGTHLSTNKLGIVKVENGFVLPAKHNDEKNLGGVVYSKGEYVKGSDLYKGYGGAYTFDRDKCTCADEKVIYIGMLVDVWGHCLTDCLKHLWFLLTDEYKDKYTEYRVVYIPVNGFTFSDNVKEMLEILGLSYDEWLPVTDVTVFSEIIVPDECFFKDEKGKVWFTDEYRQLIERLRKYGEEYKADAKERKVYYTYIKYAKFKQVGEYKLEKYFRDKGYEIISPEELSFRQQLELMANCSHFATTIGSSSHNTVLLPDDTEIILIPRGSYLNSYQLALDEIHGQKISYIDSSLSVMLKKDSPLEGPFFFYISKELMSYFSESVDDKRYWKYNFRDFVFYIRLGLKYNYDADYIQPEFLQKRAAEYYARYLEESFLFRIQRKYRILESLLYLKLKLSGHI